MGGCLSCSFLGLVLLVLSLDLFEAGNVGIEVSVLLKSDEKLSLLLLTVLLSLHGDGLGLDLLEGGVIVSVKDMSHQFSKVRQIREGIFLVIKGQYLNSIRRLVYFERPFKGISYSTYKYKPASLVFHK